MKLSELLPGERGQVKDMPPPLEARLEKMGFVTGSEVRCLYRAPSGDPTAYYIRGATVALRGQDAEHIEVTPWD